MISKKAVLEIITSYLGEGIDGPTLVSMTKSINSLPSISEDGFKRDIIFKLSLALSDYFNDGQLSLIKQCLNKLIPVPISDGWEEKANKYEKVLQRIASSLKDSGREGCTYSDTDYDSMCATYGYNLAVDAFKQMAIDVLPPAPTK